MTANFRYDTVRYPSLVFAHLRPDFIGSMAILHGVVPRTIDKCKVLELGCGDGVSLLSAAYAMPDATFVGVDLSKDRIAEAKDAARDIGITNVEFHYMDLMEFDVDRFGPFDFIVAHGVYSWVPPHVRERVLWICKNSLGRNGVGYISYNTYPGWHLRRLIREAPTVVGIYKNTSVEEAKQAIDFIRLAAASAPRGFSYANALSSELEYLNGRTIESLIHDELSDFNDPFYFREFVSHLENAGLAFLAETDPKMRFRGKFPREANELLDSFGDDPIRVEQCMDFLRGTRFRSTLICHPEALPKYAPDLDSFDGLYFSSASKPTDPNADLTDNSSVEFTTENGTSFSTDFGFVKAFISELSDQFPKRVSFAAFLERLRESFSDMPPEEFSEKSAILREHALALVQAGIFEITCFAPAFESTISEKPAVSSFARWQMRMGPSYVTTVTGKNIKPGSENMRELMILLDGTRTVSQAFDAIIAKGDMDLDSARETVEDFRDLALLVA